MDGAKVMIFQKQNFCHMFIFPTKISTLHLLGKRRKTRLQKSYILNFLSFWKSYPHFHMKILFNFMTLNLLELWLKTQSGHNLFISDLIFGSGWSGITVLQIFFLKLLIQCLSACGTVVELLIVCIPNSISIFLIHFSLFKWTE